MNSFGTLKIFTQTPKIPTGTPLTGQITLNLLTPVPTNLIILTLKGKEKVKMAKRVVDHSRTNSFHNRRNHHNHKQIHYKTIFEEDSEKLIDLKIPIYNENGVNFGVGNHIVPFLIDIKDGLPSSFLYSYNFYGEKCKAEIKYKLEAFLQIGNSGSLKDKLKIEIIETLPEFQNGASFYHQNLFVKKQKDNYSFSGQLEKDFFQFGETANAVIGCDNRENDVSIKKLKWKFVQYLKFHTRDNTMVKFERNRITKVHMEKVKHGKNVFKNLKIPIISSDRNGFANVGSFKSKLIECVYKIEFYAVSRFLLFFTKNHKIDIKIKVFKKNNKFLKGNYSDQKLVNNFNNNGNGNFNNNVNGNFNNNGNGNFNNNVNGNFNNKDNENFNNNDVDDNEIDINPVNYPEL